jgi:hypothetical protein
LKQALISAPVLLHPDHTKPFTVYCDASKHAIGGMLSQKGREGKMHPVAFGSYCFSAAQRQWTTEEKETYSVVHFITKVWRHFLAAAPFTVVTDHKNITNLRVLLESNDRAISTARVGRWAGKLQGFNFKIFHKPGKENLVADALSRPPFAQVDEKVTDQEDRRLDQIALDSFFDRLTDEPVPPQAVTPPAHTVLAVNASVELLQTANGTAAWAQAQRNDPCLMHVFALLRGDRVPKHTAFRRARKIAKDAMIRDGGCIFLAEPTGAKEEPSVEDRAWRLVVPTSRVRDVLHHYHDVAGGHRAEASVLHNIRQRFWWRRMSSDVRDYIKTCDECQASRRTVSSTAGPQQHHPTPDDIAEAWSIDLVSMPLSEDGFKKVIVATDSFSRYAVTRPSQDAEAVTVARFIIDHIVNTFGVPLRIHTDGGSEFDNKLQTILFQTYGIKHTKISPQHPQGNPTERTNQSLISIIRKAVAAGSTQSSWPLVLSAATMAYNSSIHSTTGQLPYVVTFATHWHGCGARPVESNTTATNGTGGRCDTVRATNAATCEGDHPGKAGIVQGEA